ncbi:hypothetical protein COLO4_22773 [Corchorus olitorius]|uniref:DUF3741 domain-containing protein n=1 Tax=Corchorus olitorius TaxID=93759 RepID=A0A1R3IJX0_9ROSI|nr:hypothetical protein COLO4_22773 [Corchorus olitorius]
MKRQSSSSRRKQSSIGCMSAIFNLLAKQHNRSKFLTSSKETPPTSPMLPSEMRRSNSVEMSPRHTVVTRLMGLDKFPEPAVDSTADKRRKLLGALDKCDEDLKALQSIVEAVKKKNINYNIETSKSLEAVIHDLKKGINGGKLQLKNTKPGEEERISFIARRRNDNMEMSGLWRISKAMAESVDGVCKDIAWGEKREIGRIGLALQDHICKDLIEEIVREMQCCYTTYSLPFQACKRGLSF